MYAKMAKDGEKGGWKEYIWNPRTREFLGRTASSWGEYCPSVLSNAVNAVPWLRNRSVRERP